MSPCWRASGWAAAQGEQSAARGAEAFDALADDGSVPRSMRDLAALRAALLRIDSDPAAAAAAMEQIATPGKRLSLIRPAKRSGSPRCVGAIMMPPGRWFDQMAADPENARRACVTGSKSILPSWLQGR